MHGLTRVEPIDGHAARKDETRNRLLDAAETLVRVCGGVSFSTRALAARAGVSPATPFNHFGSKRGVLAGIIARSLEDLSEQLAARARTPDPIEQIFVAGDTVTSFYASDAALYRPVFAELLGSRRDEPNPLFEQAAASWLSCLEAAHAAGRIESGRSLEVIASQLETHWIGTLSGWTAGGFSKTEWIARTRYGIALVLTSVTPPSEQLQLRKRTLEMEKKLSHRALKLSAR